MSQREGILQISLHRSIREEGGKLAFILPSTIFYSKKEKCSCFLLNFKPLLASVYTYWRPSICLCLAWTLSQEGPANTLDALGSLTTKAINPKPRLSSKEICFVVWVLPKFTTQLLQSFHPNPSHFTTPANWGPLGKTSLNSSAVWVRQWIKHQLYMNICFPDFYKAGTVFDIACDLFILKNLC